MPKFFILGQKAAEKMPPALAKIIAERLDALEKGLLIKTTNGDKELIHNNDLRGEIRKFKVDMGLKE